MMMMMMLHTLHLKARRRYLPVHAWTCLCCKHQLHGAVQNETIATQIQFIMNLIVMILFECISKKKELKIASMGELSPITLAVIYH